MDRLLHPLFSFFHCSSCHAILRILWVCGLLLGTLAGVHAGSSILFSSSSGIYSSEAALFWLLLFRLLPLLAVVLFLRISQPSFLFAVVFYKAFVFSFAAICLISVLGSSAWLIYCLLFFGDGLVLTIYWLVWIRLFSVNFHYIESIVLISAIVIALITCFDCAFIAPFMAKLI